MGSPIIRILGVMLLAAYQPQVAVQQPTTPPSVVVAGSGPVTYVLLSGIIGGVAGFRRLQGELVARGNRVIVIDPYALSLDSTDVTFAALARRVDVVLERLGVDSARVVGHAHGGGVALRLAAHAPARVSALYLLDVGALEQNRTKVFSSAIRLVPLITRLPGGRRFIRGQIIRGVKQNAGHQEWLDSATQRAYTDPLIDQIGRVVKMAARLAEAREAEPLAAVVARVRAPVVILAGAVPHPSGPDSAEFTALAPLGRRLRVERLTGVGHFPHEEVTADVARRLLADPDLSPSSYDNHPLRLAPRWIDHASSNRVSHASRRDLRHSRESPRARSGARRHSSVSCR